MIRQMHSNYSDAISAPGSATYAVTTAVRQKKAKRNLRSVVSVRMCATAAELVRRPTGRSTRRIAHPVAAFTCELICSTYFASNLSNMTT